MSSDIILYSSVIGGEFSSLGGVQEDYELREDLTIELREDTSFEVRDGP